jgi:hypothetical protein
MCEPVSLMIILGEMQQLRCWRRVIVSSSALLPHQAASNFESYFSLGVERLKAPHSKFDCGRPDAYPFITESPVLSAFLLCRSVLHLFLSPAVPCSSVAISVATNLICSPLSRGPGHHQNCDNWNFAGIFLSPARRS